MTAQFQVACPKCGQAYTVAGSLQGRSTQCKKCGTSFQLSDKRTQPASASQAVSGARSTAGGSNRAAATSTGSGSRPRTAEAPSQVNLPTQIGPYEIRKKLGQGAFGVVYLGYHPFLDIQVAVKMLRAEVLSSPAAVERFLREAKILARMEHANVLRVYDAGKHGNDHYLASAYIPGNDLGAILPEDGLEPCRAAKLVVQMLRGLGYAHAQGIVHRDIKPSNTRLGENDTLTLMDFGLAGWAVQEETAAPTGKEAMRLTHGAVMGTPAYMSPEQASGMTDHAGPASDLYSAGVVLYELLTGQLPFEANSLPALFYAIISTEPGPPSQLRPGLDPQLDAICLKALAKDPANRYRTAEEFEEALEEWLCTQIDLSSVPPPAAPRSTATPAGARPADAQVRSTQHVAVQPVEATAVAIPVAPAPSSSKGMILLIGGILVGLLLLCLGIGGTFLVMKMVGKPAEPTRRNYFDDRDKYKH